MYLHNHDDDNSDEDNDHNDDVDADDDADDDDDVVDADDANPRAGQGVELSLHLGTLNPAVLVLARAVLGFLVVLVLVFVVLISFWNVNSVLVK